MARPKYNFPTTPKYNFPQNPFVNVVAPGNSAVPIGGGVRNPNSYAGRKPVRGRDAVPLGGGVVAPTIPTGPAYNPRGTRDAVPLGGGIAAPVRSLPTDPTSIIPPPPDYAYNPRGTRDAVPLGGGVAAPVRSLPTDPTSTIPVPPFSAVDPRSVYAAQQAASQGYVDPRAQYAAEQAAQNQRFNWRGNEMSAIEAQNILANPSALTAFMLGALGYGDTPTMRSAFDPYMQNLPILQLLQVAGLGTDGGNYGLVYDAEGNVDIDATSAQFADMLGASGGFDLGANTMQTLMGQGFDPMQLMAAYFGAGQGDAQGTIGALIANSGSASDQVSMAKDIITASMMNGNPYMTGVLRTMVDALGTSYQAQGGLDKNGFTGWLLQNSLFGPLMQGAIGGTGR